MKAVVVALTLLLAVSAVVIDAKIGSTRRLNRMTDRLKTKPADVQAAVLAAVVMRDHFRQSYCTDSVSFPGNARIGFSPLKSAPTPVHTTFQDSSVPITVAGGDHDAIVAAGNKIWDNKAGCCTTFAVALFAKLAPTAGTKGPRIEIVSVGAGSSGTHVFLVVGRSAGGDGVKPNRFGKGGSFPKCANWGDDAVVLDPWLMSLGHDGVNETPTAGPRVALCSGGTCDGKQNPLCGKDETHCFTHGESLGFDGNTVLLFEKARVA